MDNIVKRNPKFRTDSTVLYVDCAEYSPNLETHPCRSCPVPPRAAFCSSREQHCTLRDARNPPRAALWGAPRAGRIVHNLFYGEPTRRETVAVSESEERLNGQKTGLTLRECHEMRVFEIPGRNFGVQRVMRWPKN